MFLGTDFFIIAYDWIIFRYTRDLGIKSRNESEKVPNIYLCRAISPCCISSIVYFFLSFGYYPKQM